MYLNRGCVARDKDDSEEIESIESTEEGVVEMGEMERSLAGQEMTCGAMISNDRAKQCHNPCLT
jgi:hypothetical protein